MVETAAHLTDYVFPRLPVRQWVLSVPKRLRYFMQRDGAVLGMELRIFLSVIAQSLSANCPGTDNWASRKRVFVAVSLRCRPILRDCVDLLREPQMVQQSSGWVSTDLVAT